MDQTSKWSAPSHPELPDTLAVHPDQSEGTEAYLGYPVIKNGKVYRSGVIAAKQRSAQQGETRIEAAADRLLKMIDSQQAAFVPSGNAVELSAMPTTINGQPVQYAWKEMLPLGTYRDARGRKFTVTPDRISKLSENFRRAFAKGLKPFIPDRHDTTSGSHNYGYVVDVRTNADGTLEGLHQLIGADAHLAASRNRTSVMLLKNVKDADGDEYDELIYHNALIPNPQLTNLKDFGPAFAASSGLSGEAVVLIQAASEPKGESDMDLLKKLREHFGAAELTEAQAMEKVTALSQSHDSTVAELEKAKASLQLASTPPKADPRAAKVVEYARRKAVEQARVTPAVADKLMEYANQHAPLALSWSGDDETDVFMEGVFNILADNEPVALGGVTGAQTIPNPLTDRKSVDEAELGRADAEEINKRYANLK